MPKRSMWRGIVLLLIIVAAAALLVLAVHERERYSMRQSVIQWAQKCGMQIDSWKAGEINEHFDDQAWVREGRAIPGAEEVILQLLEDHDDRIHPILLVQALGVVGTEKSVPVLIQQLHNPWEVMRAEVIYVLGCIGGPEARREVARQVYAAPTSGERRNAAKALVRTGSPAAISTIEYEIGRLREEQEYLQKTLVELRQGGGRQGSRRGQSSSQPQTAASQSFLPER